MALLTVVLRAPAADSFLSLTAPSSLNATKTLLASAERSSSTVYEFTSVSNQSDFIPRYPDRFASVTKTGLFPRNLAWKPKSQLKNLHANFFFPDSFGELHFAPGDSELQIAINVLDDDLPEEQEHFKVSLKNPKGGAEIGFGGQVTVIVPANDDAHGVVGFAHVSRSVSASKQLLMTASSRVAEEPVEFIFDLS